MNPTLYGYTVCECIVTSAPFVEARFRAAGLIVNNFAGLFSQGCYSTAVSASKMTHARGGVIDMKDWTAYKADADVLFTDCGWIAFYRWPNELYPGSPGHWHIVLYGCPHLHPDAAAQITAAKNGLNGLAGKGKDSGPRPMRTWQEAMGATPTITHNEQDDDMYVESMVGGGLALVTDNGSVDLGNTANADAVLSALNARASRVMTARGWQIVPSPSPCLPSEAATLNAFITLIRDMKPADSSHVDADSIAAALIAAGLADVVVNSIAVRLTN